MKEDSWERGSSLSVLLGLVWFLLVKIRGGQGLSLRWEILAEVFDYGWLAVTSFSSRHVHVRYWHILLAYLLVERLHYVIDALRHFVFNLLRLVSRSGRFSVSYEFKDLLNGLVFLIELNYFVLQTFFAAEPLLLDSYKFVLMIQTCFVCHSKSLNHRRRLVDNCWSPRVLSEEVVHVSRLGSLFLQEWIPYHSRFSFLLFPPPLLVFFISVLSFPRWAVCLYPPLLPLFDIEVPGGLPCL